MKQTAPLLIAPECSAPNCYRDGEQYMMIKCRSCGHWFCEEHLEGAEDSQSQRAQVPTVKLVETGVRGLTYYLGYCSTCRDTHATRSPIDSTWLR